MSPSLRSTRRTTPSQPMISKENVDADAENTNASPGTASNRRSRHRLTTVQLTRLEDVFRQQTHPNRQQKKDLAVELGMDYKTVTIWFQNKRQTSKRSQPPSPDRQAIGAISGRTKTDSRLRSVTSPSRNATLDASDVDSKGQRSQSKGPIDVVASKAIVKIRPFLDSLNILTSKPREHVESRNGNGEAADHKDAGDTQPLMTSELEDEAPPEIPGNEEMVVQEPMKDKFVKWKRLRTLEWACERQTKRRRLSKEGYTRLGSEEIQDVDNDQNDLRTESALSLLSLASSTHVGPTKDVMMGAALLISLKNSWSRK